MKSHVAGGFMTKFLWVSLFRFLFDFLGRNDPSQVPYGHLCEGAWVRFRKLYEAVCSCAGSSKERGYLRAFVCVPYRRQYQVACANAWLPYRRQNKVTWLLVRSSAGSRQWRGYLYAIALAAYCWQWKVAWLPRNHS